MPNIPSNTKDPNLLKALQTSALSEEEKKEFEGLLETMSEDVKLKLKNLIEESNQAKQAFEAEKGRQLAELNKATGEKLKIVEKEELKYVREEFEKFDQHETEKELTNLEGNLEGEKFGKEDESPSQEIKNKVQTSPETPLKSHQEKRNYILILLSLILLAGTLIFGLLTL